MRQQIISAAITTAVAISILIALGVWQVHRLRWKEGILARIAAAEQAAPVELDSGGAPSLFTRLQVSGTLRGGAALFGVEVRGERLGAQEIEVLDRPGTPPVLVDLGWVPIVPAPPPPATGPVRITGYVRRGETPNFLSAANDIEGRHLYTMQPEVFGRVLHAPDAPDFVLVALGKPQAGGPEPAQSLPRPPNNHLQYAFTWFGLAAALVAVFIAWAFGEQRSASTG